MRVFLKYFILISVICCSKAEKPPNVLFVMLDDFRGGINALGDTLAKTPNIDQLVEKSYYFTRVYAQQALCAPSRNSMLTSRRPDTLLTYNFQHYWRTFAGNFTTLPQYFKELGYRTESIGKIFHHGPSSNKTDDYPYSWTSPTFIPSTQEYRNKPVCKNDESFELQRNLLCPVLVDMQPEQTLPDIQSAKKAREFLSMAHDEPFFLALGFYKPHIPLKFPAEYLKLHDENDFRKDYLRPFDLPTVAWAPFNDIRDREDIKSLNISWPFGPIPSEFSARIRQHYYASVSYVDELLGSVLQAVNLTDTIILLTSDHGWALGEHGMWSKYQNFEVSLKVPLIIFDPKKPQARVKRINSIAELIDIFPTLIDVAGLPEIPNCKQHSLDNYEDDNATCTEGKSLYSKMINDAIKSDDDDDDDAMAGAAFSQYPRPSSYPSKIPDSDQPRLREIKIMGYSVRTNRFRYTAWIKFNNKKFKRNWQRIYGEELYDHQIDRDENINLVSRPAFEEIKNKLKQQLMRKFPKKIIRSGLHRLNVKIH